jgi:hypothetical protein
VFLSWPQDDRDKAIWSYARKRSTCPGCGTRPDEWLDDDGQPIDAYEAKTHLCRGCRAHEMAQEDLGDQAPKGVHIVLKRRLRGEHS